MNFLPLIIFIFTITSCEDSNIVSNKKTNSLCQVAEYLTEVSFEGDFYVYDTIQFCYMIDPIDIPEKIVSTLKEEKIEYVARIKDRIEFGFYPDKIKGETGVWLCPVVKNLTIDYPNGNGSHQLSTLNNPKCIGWTWYFCQN